jgi:hypothetical protein
MNENLFETIEKSCGVLQLPFSAKEFAQLAEEHALSAEATRAVALIFEHMQQKKIEGYRPKYPKKLLKGAALTAETPAAIAELCAGLIDDDRKLDAMRAAMSRLSGRPAAEIVCGCLTGTEA